MRAAVIFDNFGPYHLARLRASTRVCDLAAVEVAASSAEYKWKREEKNKFQLPAFGASGFKAVTLFQQSTSREISHGELVHKLNEALDASRAQVVFIPGWSSRAAFAALRWCVRNNVPAVAMSESTEWDETRTGWKEWMKRKLVGLFATALVGGNPHKDYMVKLGMPPERIFLGYDVVDNEYFKEKAEMLKAESREQGTSSGLRPPSPQGGEGKLPENYFLASARFVEKKNLPCLLQAYALYRKKAETLKTEMLKAEGASTLDPRPSTPWSLVLLGDGALRPALNLQLSTLNLQPFVHLPGFRQYPDLPAYYALAGAFIHASTTEPWGLVVNEAMASGLPVLVSNRCGCAADLVQEGVNGFTFDPCDTEQLAQLMLKISAFQPFKLSAFGDASRTIISDWGPERFAAGLKAAAECALHAGPVKATVMQRLILNALLWK